MVTFDPVRIVSQIEKMREKILEAKKNKKNILVVSEKALIAKDVAELCDKNWYHYMNTKIPAGFLTNFETLIWRIEAMNQRKEFITSESYEKLTKKEQSMMKRELSKVERVYSWVKNLKWVPDLVIVIDGMQMKSLVKELQMRQVSSVILASSNFTTWWNDDSLLVMNMQSYKSLSYALNYLLS